MNLRRLLLCRGGRRCADVEITSTDAPPGTVLVVTYVCSRCKTRYRRETVVR